MSRISSIIKASKIRWDRYSKIITALTVIGLGYLFNFVNPVNAFSSLDFDDTTNTYTITGYYDSIEIDTSGDYTINVVGQASINRIIFDHNLTNVNITIVGSGNGAVLNVSTDIKSYELTIRNCSVNASRISADNLEIRNSNVKAETDDQFYAVQAIGNVSIINSSLIAKNTSISGYGLSMNSPNAESLIIENSTVTLQSSSTYFEDNALYAPSAYLTMSGNSTLSATNPNGGVAIAIEGFANPDSFSIATPQGGVIRDYMLNKSIYADENAAAPANQVLLVSPPQTNNYTNNNNVVRNNTANKDNEPPKVQAPPHVHSYSWQVIQEPTAESDGYEAYMCSGCGDVKETSPLPAMSVFDEEVIAKIKNAPKFGTVKIETTHWNTLGRSIRDALTARPDVTLKISFLSEGHMGIPLKVTLPAGTDITGMFDENGYLGLCRAGSTLGYDQ